MVHPANKRVDELSNELKEGNYKNAKVLVNIGNNAFEDLDIKHQKKLIEGIESLLGDEDIKNLGGAEHIAIDLGKLAKKTENKNIQNQILNTIDNAAKATKNDHNRAFFVWVMGLCPNSKSKIQPYLKHENEFVRGKAEIALRYLEREQKQKPKAISKH